MADLSQRVKDIKKLVDDGQYFTISRGRQYGKTTTLTALKQQLKTAYLVLSLDFQRLDYDVFENGATFSQAMSRIIMDAHKFEDVPVPEDTLSALDELNRSNPQKIKMDHLFRILKRWIKHSERPIVLMIDEIDSAANTQVFLDFLAQLRDGYIRRDTDKAPAFQFVILAGVTDVKSLNSRIRPEDRQRVTSPWNIASDFDIDMSLSEEGIRGMPDEYEADHHTGMDTAEIATSVREYTNGYPYLVSRICQIIDTDLLPGVFNSLHDAWTRYGIDEAVKKILSQPNNTLFASLTGKLADYPALRSRIRALLMRGETFAWLPYDEAQQQLFMHGFIRNNRNRAALSCRIFEMLLSTQFIGESDQNNDLKQIAAGMKSAFVDEEGGLDIPKMMDHFIREHNRIHNGQTDTCLEEEGRERFITYVSGIINGTGTYHVEEQLRDDRQADLVIHYLGRRYVIQLKTGHGERYHSEDEKQLTGCLDDRNLNTGYLLRFNLNKEKASGVRRIQLSDRVLYEGTV